MPHIKKKTILKNGKWLSLKEISYIDSEKIERSWESVDRLKCDGAVVIIATIHPSKEIILIKQYRPPTDSYIIEFPAGLIDEGESPESTAVRELYEETGYNGKITKVTEPVFNSPGLTGEKVHIAFMQVNEECKSNHRVVPELEDGEEIETIRISFKDLSCFLEQAQINGDKVDAKVALFATALDFTP